MKNKINNLILKLTGLALIKPFPKHSIRFAKEHFKGKLIEAIEIGTFEGKNAKDILDNLNIERLHLIDPWEEYGEYELKKTQRRLNKAYEKTKKRLAPYHNKTYYLLNYSSNVVNKFSPVDFIYIDGNHSYKYVLEDCKNYWEKVKEGGILAGHDISMVEVLNAVQDFSREKGLNFQVAGQDWWIVKSNSIKQEVEGGKEKMRNEETPAQTPTVHEREINLTLINDKLNYVIQLFNKVAEKEGISLED